MQILRPHQGPAALESGVGPRSVPAPQLFRGLWWSPDFENRRSGGSISSLTKWAWGCSSRVVSQSSPHERYSICQKRHSLREFRWTWNSKPKSISLQISFLCPQAFACHARKQAAKRGCSTYWGSLCTLLIGFQVSKVSAPSSVSLEITDVSSDQSLEILGYMVACSPKGQLFAYDHFFFKPKRIQFTNKSVLQTWVFTGLPIPCRLWQCTSISDIWWWPVCFPIPPHPRPSVPQAYSVCAVEGTQFPGLRAGSGAHRSPAAPTRDSQSELMWVSFVRWVRLPTTGSGDLECQGPKLN